jgi:hypothetical protein
MSFGGRIRQNVYKLQILVDALARNISVHSRRNLEMESLIQGLLRLQDFGFFWGAVKTKK